MRTDIRIHGLFIQFVEMCIPPFHPAFIGAKFLLFAARILRDGRSAIEAEMLRQLFLFDLSRELVPAAEGFDRILGYSQSLRYSNIAHATLSQDFNLFFLFICHINTLPLSKCFPIYKGQNVAS